MSENKTPEKFVTEPEPIPKIGRSERARAEIQNAAVRFLWSRPFREMTINKLMAKTSLSRAAFYYHFADVHELMEELLRILEAEILQGASPWLSEDGDPVALLCESLTAEVELCRKRGPMLKAISDAAGSDARLEALWYGLLDRFDDVVSERIAADQALGLIEDFEPRPLASALNQANAALYIRVFGQHPPRQPKPERDAISRLWISSLYGQQWVANRRSTLYRKQPLVASIPQRT